ncbi:hypothetical protein RAS1_02140 [Phycisphaerae bacterium RAS1]|nr:hypothetical protein RAS1_02140 [Phycisphaerae bacterium RAS1]
MSMDRSLRLKTSLARHRNVLSRAERVLLLQEQEKWRNDMSPLGMPKVGNRKVRAAAKKKEEKAEEGAAAAPGAAAPAAAAAPAPAGKK